MHFSSHAVQYPSRNPTSNLPPSPRTTSLTKIVLLLDPPPPEKTLSPAPVTAPRCGPCLPSPLSQLPTLIPNHVDSRQLDLATESEMGMKSEAFEQHHPCQYLFTN